MKISKKDLKILFFRSLSLEWSWNFNYHQQLGFSVAMNPAMKKIFPNETNKVFESNLDYFNTNPYLSTFIFSSILSELEKEPIFDSEKNETLKNTLTTSLAGIGDRWFWGNLRVIAALSGIEFALDGNFIGVVIFLLLFNIPTMYVRWKGTFIGYEKGISLLYQLEESGLINHISKALDIITALTVGATVMVLVNNYPLFSTIQELKSFYGFPMLIIFCSINFLQKKVKPICILIIGTALCILASALNIL